jgi:hypothetical protein
MSAPLELTASTFQDLADSSHEITAWLEQGRTISQADNQRQFAVGDWLACGDDKWGRTAYAKAATIFRGYTRATLKDFCQVARRVQVPLRNGTLSWAHHKAVARFTNPELQRDLLAKAADKSMSVAVFRKHINQQFPPQSSRPTRPKSILVPLSEEDLLWLQVIAFRADNCSLADAVKLVVRDWRATWRSKYEGVPYAPAHPSLNEFYSEKVAA